MYPWVQVLVEKKRKLDPLELKFIFAPLEVQQVHFIVESSLSPPKFLIFKESSSFSVMNVLIYIDIICVRFYFLHILTITFFCFLTSFSELLASGYDI